MVNIPICSGDYISGLNNLNTHCTPRRARLRWPLYWGVTFSHWGNNASKSARTSWYGLAAAEPAAILKMQVQTAVIQDDGAHCGGLVVGHKLLGVDETGRVLVDLHAARGQPRIDSCG